MKKSDILILIGLIILVAMAVVSVVNNVRYFNGG